MISRGLYPIDVRICRTNCDLQSQKAQYAILLSGTPALSRPIELFPRVNVVSRFSCTCLIMLKSRVRTFFFCLHIQLQALYPTVYRNVSEYGDRYCKGVSTRFIKSLHFLLLTVTDKYMIFRAFLGCIKVLATMRSCII
jgi:hypothetical protein